MEVMKELTFEELVGKIETKEFENMYRKSSAGDIKKVDGWRFTLKDISETKFYELCEFENDGIIILSEERYIQLSDKEKMVKEIEEQTGEIFSVLKKQVNEIWNQIKQNN